VSFDLDAALGSNKEWYYIQPIHVTQWDGTQQYFNIELAPQSTDTPSNGHISVAMQNFYSAPKFSYGAPLYSYSSSGQHTLNILCQGRSSTVKLLLRVTSDWS